MPNAVNEYPALRSMRGRSWQDASPELQDEIKAEYEAIKVRARIAATVKFRHYDPDKRRLLQFMMADRLAVSKVRSLVN